ncbi:unnamed protein product [Rhizophagus irregularis]|nr:unnamed protein product [Rhizophagus irregularis]CAB5384885.1 unnamed protein product [Rhizophagus irregularis]
MSSDKSEEIPWLEDLEVEEASSSEASGSKSLLLNQASKASINSKRKTTRAKLDMGYLDQYKLVGQYKRIVRCLAQVQRKNGAE